MRLLIPFLIIVIGFGMMGLLFIYQELYWWAKKKFGNKDLGFLWIHPRHGGGFKFPYFFYAEQPPKVREMEGRKAELELKLKSVKENSREERTLKRDISTAEKFINKNKVEVMTPLGGFNTVGKFRQRFWMFYEVDTAAASQPLKYVSLKDFVRNYFKEKSWPYGSEENESGDRAQFDARMKEARIAHDNLYSKAPEIIPDNTPYVIKPWYPRIVTEQTHSPTWLYKKLDWSAAGRLRRKRNKTLEKIAQWATIGMCGICVLGVVVLLSMLTQK